MKSPIVVALLLTLASCKDGSPKVTQPQVEAGASAAAGACSSLEGIDDSGTLRTICASVDEAAQIASFILTLRRSSDAGTPKAMAACTTLPSTTLCATSAEIAKGILFVSTVRQRRLMRDAEMTP